MTHKWTKSYGVSETFADLGLCEDFENILKRAENRAPMPRANPDDSFVFPIFSFFLFLKWHFLQKRFLWKNRRPIRTNQNIKWPHTTHALDFWYGKIYDHSLLPWKASAWVVAILFFGSFSKACRFCTDPNY